MALTEILLVILTVVFVILVGYLINLIMAVTKTLKEVRKMLLPLNEISENFQKKMNKLDPLFGAISNVGERLEIKTAVLKEQHHWKCLSQKESGEPQPEESVSSEEVVSDVIEWALLGVSIWKNFKKRR